MIVTVSIKIDVDVKGWATEYGLEPTAKEVRQDVKDYTTSVITEQFAAAYGSMAQVMP